MRILIVVGKKSAQINARIKKIIVVADHNVAPFRKVQLQLKRTQSMLLRNLYNRIVIRHFYGCQLQELSLIHI